MLRRILTIVAIWLTTLLVMVIQKPIFLLWYAERAAEASSSELWGVVWHGLLLDSTTAGYISVVPWLIMLLSIWIVMPERLVQRLLKGYFILIALVSSLLVAVDMGLFGYWDFRLDSTILPYLATPKEAAASLTWHDIWPTTLLFVGYGALTYLLLRRTCLIYRAERLRVGWRVAATLLMILQGGFIFLAIRGGLGTSPANVSKVYFSEKMFLNQAATNPIFSFLSSASRSELKQDDYQYYSDTECNSIFSTIAGKPTPSEKSPQLLNTPRPNVVLILLESFGRTITDEVVDGKQVTPYLNALKSKGVWFENIIANSFRTDRGQVAAMSGYPTHPVVSIMKYPQKAHTLPSIARSLQREGYATSFTYGGDANFTNTISYLYGTGVERITDQRSLTFEQKPTIWGYDDRLVCDYFADEVLELSGKGKPFFASLLTLSSHEPFEVPHSAFENKILNSASFADECVGKMIERWRESEAWEDMLIVLIADHGISYPGEIATGDLRRQRIPMLWTGGAIKEPMVVDSYASQCDMAATLLHQMGIATPDFRFSRDILDPDSPHFAFWSYNNAFGMITNQGYTVYNCTSESIVEQSGESLHTKELESLGKAILQTIHQDLCDR